MFDLFSFYRSKEWRLLIQHIRHDRINGEGLTMCEYCGKSIVKEYDCIAHHKIYLTEDNVNDYSISLNPDNIMLVHHKCHNIIHDKLSYRGRKVYMVYGAPMAGKETYVNGVKGDGDLIVNINSIWQCVSGGDGKPNRLKSIVFGIRDYMLDSIKYRRGKWNNAYIIGGYPLISERERLCKELGAEEIFIDTSKEECLRKLESCEDRDKEEYTKYIFDWFDKYIPPL